VVRVGSEPVGLLLLDRGRVALVGDSNRYQATGGGSSPQISVVSTADALARRPAVTGSLPAGGLFPRDLSYDQATGQLLVPDFKSSAVEVLRLPRLP
jgi:DNA-binding beta-propeller fold protein YncE